MQPISIVNNENTQVIKINPEPVQLEITKGESFKEIGAILSQKSLIRSITVFKLYSFIIGSAHKFKPGTYTLSRTMSMPQIVNILTRGGRDDISVTIPEGFTLKDIDKTLHDSNVLGENNSLLKYDFKKVLRNYPKLAPLTSLEGILFPDTYRFKPNSLEEEVIKIFLDNFMVKAWPILEGDGKWYEKLTLASFLEREVTGFEDRRIVAGILLKRYKLKMPLQVDATISYIKCNGMFKNCKNNKVIRKDLRTSSPYNTYQNLGWGPTPISNPGQSAIKAAVSPIKTSYLYYLSRSDTGETLFSKTLKEHNIKRIKFL